MKFMLLLYLIINEAVDLSTASLIITYLDNRSQPANNNLLLYYNINTGRIIKLEIRARKSAADWLFLKQKSA